MAIVNRAGYRSIALALAIVVPTTATASPHADVLRMRPDEAAAPAPATSDVVIDPTPVEAPAGEPPVATATPEPLPVVGPIPGPEPAVAPPVEAIVPPPLVVVPANYQSERRDGAVSVLIGGGVVTVAGVVLILAGFGATVTALRESGCGSDNACLTDDRRAQVAGRVTLSGLVISSVGAVTLVGGMIAYGVASSRGARRPNRMFTVSPTSRSVSVGVQGRF